MRILGIDFGEKRIGLAISDESEKFAFPIKPITRTSGEIKMLAAICKENEIKKIVVGLPIGLSGRAGEAVKKVRAFALKLKKLQLPIVFEDERMTTALALRSLQDLGIPQKKAREFKDSLAAQLILQSYLDKK